MTLFAYLPFAAGIFGLLLAVGSLLPKRRSFATWCFAAGMALLGINSLLAGQTLRAAQLEDAVRGLTLILTVSSFLPAAWLGFSLTYSRGDYRGSLARWRVPLAVAAVVPIGIALVFQQQLIEVAPAAIEGGGLQLQFGPPAKALNILLLVVHVWILMNLEQTFRAAVGLVRWRIKFVVLGLAVIFGARLFVRSQAVLFSSYDPDWLNIESSALLIGCILLVVAFPRAGRGAIEVYPSRAVLSSSVTLLLTGSYLVIIGVLARFVRTYGEAEHLELQILLVVAGIALLGVLLLSDRLRQRLHAFVVRHFARAQYDSTKIWDELSLRLASVRDEASLNELSVKIVSGTFEVLAVTLWLVDEQNGRLAPVASTAPQAGAGSDAILPAALSNDIAAGLRERASPFDLEELIDAWAEELRRLNPTTFATGGNRWCVPLRTGDRILGALVLADRVNGAVYTVEESLLLQCMTDQVTSVLLNLRLADQVARSRELDALQTMSAFFVHDLKNAAASLNLTLKNLPVHFDDPAFREDALRAIGNTARRIDELTARLSAFRQKPQLKRVETALNQVVSETLDRLDGLQDVELTRDLQPLPAILVDREQIQSVVTNLVLNARDALGPGGWIRVRTELDGNSAILSVADNGCGMGAAFLKNSLFRPFQSSKKNGLGIGMFQSRMIVEAHGGSIRVESEPGKGSTFWVILPIMEQK
ncbi:MAG: PEP-CTERM system histidine kinase PrsK [Bryobacteraceae bacterium]|nr:PEP-CTERM system histidine kinase PrsK [Bryobacteraceae bacterium]